MTRQILIGEADLSQSVGRRFVCVYHLLVRAMTFPTAYESYGIRVTVTETGEREEVWDITCSARRIETLAAMLLKGGVTPCTLREVIDDWL